MSAAPALTDRLMSPPTRPTQLKCERPSEWIDPRTGERKDLSKHSPKPVAGVDREQHLAYNPYRVMEYIRTHAGTVKTNDGGYKAQRGPTQAEIAKALRVSERTVTRAIKTLHGLGYVIAHELLAETGKRLGTTFTLPPWTKVRERWHSDRSIAKTPAGDPIVWGRACRFLTPEQARAWGIPGVLDVFVREGSAARPKKQEPVASPFTNPPPPRPEMAKPPPIAELKERLEPVLDEFCGSCNDDDLVFVWSRANSAIEGDPRPTAADVAAVAEAAGRQLRQLDRRKPITVKFLASATERRMGPWQRHERKRQREAREQAQRQREQTINSVAGAMVDLDKPDLSAEDRAWLSDYVGGQPPEIIDAARKVYEGLRAGKTASAAQ